MKTTPKIVAIGDSLIYGRHDPEGGGWVNRLRSFLEGIDPMSAVYNLGIGGNDTRKLLDRIDGELAARNFTAVIVGVGSNDARRRTPESQPQVPPEEFEENLAHIVDKCGQPECGIALSSVTRVDEIRTLPLKTFYYDNRTFLQYYEITKKLSRDKNCYMIDNWKHVQETSCDIYSDGLHLSGFGHKLVSENAKTTVLEMYK